MAGILQWGGLKKPIQTQHVWEIAENLVMITLEPQGPLPGAGPKSSSLGTSSLPKGSQGVLSTSGSWHMLRGISGPSQATLPVAVSGLWLEDGNILGGKGNGGNGDWSGQLGKAHVSPVPLCSLQLAKDRSRAEEYLQQSLPYLKDPQATMREAAIRFIGEPRGPCLGSAAPGPQPWAGLPLFPPAHARGLGGRLTQCHPLGYCWFPRGPW